MIFCALFYEEYLNIKSDIKVVLKIHHSLGEESELWRSELKMNYTVKAKFTKSFQFTV